MSKKNIGLIGARGHVGGEIIQLLNEHPDMDVVMASSTSRAGETVPDTDLVFQDVTPETLSDYTWNLDALVLALPNKKAFEWVADVDAHKPDLVVLDVSADYRFDPDWVYGLTELHTKSLKGAKRISNPGCYATAAQLALQPIAEWISGTPAIFGVSGYSGAGATPSPKNDINRLRDNFMPYSLMGHIHEDEIGHHLGRPVHFSPHVAQFFRGLSITAQVDFQQPVTHGQIMQALHAQYADCEWVSVCDDIPEIAQVQGTSQAKVGGVAVSNDGRRAVIVSVIDNLRKGAASQAIQNLELALFG